MESLPVRVELFKARICYFFARVEVSQGCGAPSLRRVRVEWFKA
jgi:hypothetical protein